MKPFKRKDLRFMYLSEDSGDIYFYLLKYYAIKFKLPPSSKRFINTNIEVHSVYAVCMNDFGAKEDFSDKNYEKEHETWEQYVLSFPDYPGYLLHAYYLETISSKKFLITENLFIPEGQKAMTGSIRLAIPPKESTLSNPNFEKRIEEMMQSLRLKKLEGKPSISIIETFHNGFRLADKPIHDNFSIRDLNINYGQGFEQFHNELIARFNNSSKGLVLFHGLPGTGKTYYIRHLLREMAVAKKSVIYIPPNMVDYLTDPAFMSFLGTSAQRLAQDGKFCVLLIEDAEPLLAKREDGVRLQGITNLLNMTDGLLNDLLNLQIICTFNVDLRKLDDALLRPGRLLARKEFKALSELDSNILAQRLGIKCHFNKPTSLSEIYAMLKDQNTLVHDVEPSKDSSTPIEDLF